MTSPRPSRETILTLLEDAQSYLRSALAQQAPDSVLVLAWEEFYRIYDDLIRRFVVSHGVPYSHVDDCVQEVWCDVVEHLAGFERPPDRPGLRAWLYTLVRGKAANLFRGNARRLAENLQDASMAGREPIQPESDPVELFEKKWEAALLESVVEKLRQEVSDVNYRILRMRLFDDRDVKDVASELGVTPEQVRYRHHRVMRKLRTRLAVFTGEPLGRTDL